jgi:hypothetical protein
MIILQPVIIEGVDSPVLKNRTDTATYDSSIMPTINIFPNLAGKMAAKIPERAAAA